MIRSRKKENKLLDMYIHEDKIKTIVLKTSAAVI